MSILHSCCASAAAALAAGAGAAAGAAPAWDGSWAYAAGSASHTPHALKAMMPAERQMDMVASLKPAGDSRTARAYTTSAR